MLFTPVPFLLALAADPAPLRVHCVEARTASVFAGACHYGGEATTAGREALIAWHVESGRYGGVDLAGVDVAAAIAGDANLAEATAPRRSILYVSDSASAEQRAAAESLLRLRLAESLGEVLEARAVPLAARFVGDGYRVDAGDLFLLEGELLPDRACCKMPLAVWYRPIAPIARAVVGRNATSRFRDDRLGRVFDLHDENTGFAGWLAE